MVDDSPLQPLTRKILSRHNKITIGIFENATIRGYMLTSSYFNGQYLSLHHLKLVMTAPLLSKNWRGEADIDLNSILSVLKVALCGQSLWPQALLHTNVCPIQWNGMQKIKIQKE